MDDTGAVRLPLGLPAEAGLGPGIRVPAYSDGDGRVVLRRAEDAILRWHRDLLKRRHTADCVPGKITGYIGTVTGPRAHTERHRVLARYAIT